MSIFKGTRLFFLILLGTMILTGCLNFKTPAEEIYEVLESVVAAEQQFEEQQEPLVELEKHEKDLYDEIISLGMKEFNQIVKLSDEALTIVDKREEHIEKEKESIQASKEQFESILPIIDKIEESKVKKKANELYDTMMVRYKNTDELHTNYLKGLEYDRELYKLFQKEDLSIDELQDQIKKINDTYKIVLDANETFNEQTKKYNEIKLEFYELAGIEIKEDNKN